MKHRAGVILALAAFAAACDSRNTLEPSLQSAEDFAAAIAPGGIIRAGGRAAITVPDPLITTKPEEYSFTAIATGDGVGAKGQMEFRTHRTPERGGDIRVHAEVVCLAGAASDPGHARIGAIVRQSSKQELFPVGSGFIFGVTDRGEGKKSPPDLASSALTVIIDDASGRVDEAAVRTFVWGYCQAGISPSQQPVENGNIQVKQKG